MVLRDELAKRHAADKRAAESTTELAAARQAQHEAKEKLQAASGRAARLRQSSEQQAHMLRRAREVASAERRREPSDRTEGSRAGTPGGRSEASLSPGQRREASRLVERARGHREGGELADIVPHAWRSAPPTPDPTRDLAPELTPELAALSGGEGELQQLRDMRAAATAAHSGRTHSLPPSPHSQPTQCAPRQPLAVGRGSLTDPFPHPSLNPSSYTHPRRSPS
jgi:hypothetical protein